MIQMKRKKLRKGLKNIYLIEKKSSFAILNFYSKFKSGRYKRKTAEERKKRGPKPSPKVAQTCFQCDKTFKCAAQLQMHIR